MSPSAEYFEKKVLKRKLQKGDVLVASESSMWEDSEKGIEGGESYEVLDREEGTFEARRRSKDIDGIRVRRLSPYGPAKTTRLLAVNRDLWTEIVAAEDRTDLQREVD